MTSASTRCRYTGRCDVEDETHRVLAEQLLEAVTGQVSNDQAVAIAHVHALLAVSEQLDLVNQTLFTMANC